MVTRESKHHQLKKRRNGTLIGNLRKQNLTYLRWMDKSKKRKSLYGCFRKSGIRDGADGKRDWADDKRDLVDGKILSALKG